MGVKYVTLPMLRVIQAWVIALALALVPPLAVVDHTAVTGVEAEQIRHAVLSTTEVGEEHSHDDGQDHEQRVGHMHGHVDFDHSHDLGVRQDLRCIARPPRTNDWSILAGNCLPLDILAGLDRPPRVDGRSIPA